LSVPRLGLRGELRGDFVAGGGCFVVLLSGEEGREGGKGNGGRRGMGDLLR